MESADLRRQPLTELGFSAAFCAASLSMGFARIDDILSIPPRELVMKEGFSYTWLGELIEFLEKHKQLHLLQPLPGRSSG